MQYLELENKSALNKLKRKIPYGRDLNLYRGCEHGCKYCYAIGSHDYLNDGRFFENVYYKNNILECLEKELSSKDWKREIINIGGVTDSYQQIEAKLKLMPQVLKLMIKYKTPIIISSKSDLILRDYDLIDELSRITYVNVAQTITTMDDDIRKKLEPGSASSLARFEVLSKFSNTNASIGLHLMPIIPYLTDSFENLNEIYYLASKSNVTYVLPGTIYLLGKTKKYFFEFIKNDYPDIYEKIFLFNKNKEIKLDYKNKLYKMINEIKLKYLISSNYSNAIKEKLKN